MAHDQKVEIKLSGLMKETNDDHSLHQWYSTLWSVAICQMIRE